jgi:hypothetical protein
MGAVCIGERAVRRPGRGWRRRVPLRVIAAVGFGALAGAAVWLAAEAMGGTLQRE